MIRRAATVDAVAALTFFTAVPAVVELLIVGLDPETVLRVRLAALPMILLTARPYGLWRDLVLRRAPASGLGRTAFDMAAFLSFQMPVYAAILWIGGASGAEVLHALTVSAAMMAAVSRPFGLWLDLCRRLAGLRPGPVAPARPSV